VTRLGALPSLLKRRFDGEDFTSWNLSTSPAVNSRSGRYYFIFRSMNMFKRQAAALQLFFVLGFCAAASAGAAPTEDSHYRMFLVYRLWVDDLAAQRSLVTEEQELAHQEHIKAHSRTALSSNIHDDDGTAIGVVALNAYATREGVEYYIYEDPYTKAGFYKDIRIIPVEVDLMDSYFSIEPDWVRGEGLAIKHRRYERDGLAPVSGAGAADHE
jgi:uncharacterized protein YciI